MERGRSVALLGENGGKKLETPYVVSYIVLQVREYELYVPLHDNEGQPIDPEKLTRLKRRLVNEFGGLTHFPQTNEGIWKVGAHTFRDQIVILRVLAGDSSKADAFFLRLKEDFKRDWEQSDVLIVTRNVSAV